MGPVTDMTLLGGVSQKLSKVPLQTSFTHNFKYKNLNTIKFCTCSDSIAVGACAKFHGDQTSNIQMTASAIFDLES